MSNEIASRYVSIVNLWNEGNTSRQIGEQLCVAPETAKNYVRLIRRAYPKLLEVRGKTSRKPALAKLSIDTQKRVKRLKGMKLNELV